jgi:hypothetical protein
MNPVGATPGVMQIATGAIRKSVDNLARVSPAAPVSEQTPGNAASCPP